MPHFGTWSEVLCTLNLDKEAHHAESHKYKKQMEEENMSVR